MQDERDLGESLTSRGLPRDERGRVDVGRVLKEAVEGVVPEAEPTFGEDGRLRVDFGVAAGVPDASAPAPPPEEQVTVESPDPIVVDLNMNKIKLRELRGVERILAIVTGQAMAIMPLLEEMPADLMIAILAHKKLVAEGLDCSRMNDTEALHAANEIREAFAWAEEIDFGDLGAPPTAPGEGKAPADPTAAGSGSEPGLNTSASLTSKPPS